MLKDQMMRLGGSKVGFMASKLYPVALLLLLPGLAYANGNAAIPVIGGVLVMTIGLLYFLRYVKLQTGGKAAIVLGFVLSLVAVYYFSGDSSDGIESFGLITFVVPIATVFVIYVLVKRRSGSKPSAESEMKIIDKLAWIEIRDRQILSTRSCGKDKFYIPGGKREPGETDAQALVREIKEELSVSIESSTMHYLGTFEAPAHGYAQNVNVKMTCYSATYFGELQASSEIEELRWLRHSDKDKISEVDTKIFDYLKFMNLID